ncbi:MAG: hypothetical protein QW318_03400 [Candidatus Caldarchaeum sp.]|jgi:hypothetical protein
MVHRSRSGISEAAAAAAALLVALAVALAAYGIYARNTSAAVAGFEKESGNQAVKISERLTLVYWASDGRAWIANDGPDPVTVIQIYVDANLAWSGNATLAPRQMQVFSLPSGSALAVKTSSGALHVLTKEWTR